MKKLINFYFRHRKFCIAMLVICVAAAVFVVPNIASAEEATTAEGDINKLILEINQIFNYLLGISSMWLWPIVMMCGSLLDNDLIFGGAMGERLLNVWVEIRNLVNIVFVLILLAIAVYNVLGLGEEGGGLPLAFKTAIPKFVLALIAVNFSFLGMKVFLDFTNTLTGAVFALPTTSAIISEDAMQNKVENYICGTDSAETPGAPLWCEGRQFNARAKAFFSKLDRNNITLVYALRFGRAVPLKFIKEGLKDLGQLTFNVIFNSILYIVYAISFIVLFIVLLARIVVLWVAVVLSPLIALTIVLPDLAKMAGEGGGKIKEMFVDNAIIPLKVGLVLSVGYIMLDGLEADKSIHGNILAGTTLTSLDPNTLPTDITDLQQLMIAVAMVVIIWAGVFMAADKSVAKGLTNIIKTNVEGIGKWVAKLPAYAQIIPVKGKSGETKQRGLMEMIGGIQYKARKWQSERSYGGPEAVGLAMQEKGKAGDTAGFVRDLSGNPAALGDLAGVNGLKALLETSKASTAVTKELARAIKSMGPKEKDSIVREIYSHKYNSDEVVKQVRGALGRDEATALINVNKTPGTTEAVAAEGAEKGAAAAEKKAASPPAQDATEVRTQLLDTTQSAATVAAAARWDEAAVTTFRTFPENIKQALLGTGGALPKFTAAQMTAISQLRSATAGNIQSLVQTAKQGPAGSPNLDNAVLTTLVNQFVPATNKAAGLAAVNTP